MQALHHHGEFFNGAPNEAPEYEGGFWIYETKTYRELGLDIDEMEEGHHASDVGPVKPSDYVPFLKEFRHIVEGRGEIDHKEAKISMLCRKNATYSSFCSKLHSFYEDFPSSFFYNQLTIIPGIGSKTAKAFYQVGYKTIEDLKNASDEKLLSVEGIGPKGIKNIRDFLASQET